MSESIVSIRWGKASFEINRDGDDGDFEIEYSDGKSNWFLSGPQFPELISQACKDVGFNEETKWELLFSLMNSLRERLFN